MRKYSHTIKHAFCKSIPVLAGYIVIGIGFGILMRNAGYGVLFTEQWLRAKDHIPAITGIICTLLCLVVFGKENFLIPAMLMIALVLTILRKREEYKS